MKREGARQEAQDRISAAGRLDCALGGHAASGGNGNHNQHPHSLSRGISAKEKEIKIMTGAYKTGTLYLIVLIVLLTLISPQSAQASISDRRGNAGLYQRVYGGRQFH